MITDYIQERYPEFINASHTAVIYMDRLISEQYSSLVRGYGFIIYKFVGDACVIKDIYVKQEYRKTKKAWQLWTDMLYLIQATANCHVVIGFSEYTGTNHSDGIGAMLAAGFIKAYDTEDRTVYMRGTQ
jgi:hypothetical protein